MRKSPLFLSAIYNLVENLMKWYTGILSILPSWSVSWHGKRVCVLQQPKGLHQREVGDSVKDAQTGLVYGPSVKQP